MANISQVESSEFAREQFTRTLEAVITQDYGVQKSIASHIAKTAVVRITTHLGPSTDLETNVYELTAKDLASLSDSAETDVQQVIALELKRAKTILSVLDTLRKAIDSPGIHYPYTNSLDLYNYLNELRVIQYPDNPQKDQIGPYHLDPQLLTELQAYTHNYAPLQKQQLRFHLRFNGVDHFPNNINTPSLSTDEGLNELARYRQIVEEVQQEQDNYIAQQQDETRTQALIRLKETEAEANVLLKQLDSAKARKDYASIINLYTNLERLGWNPEDKDVNLAEAHFELGETGSSARHFKNLINADPRNPKLYIALIQMYLQSKHPERGSATAALINALELFPGNKDLLQLKQESDNREW